MLSNISQASERHETTTANKIDELRSEIVAEIQKGLSLVGGNGAHNDVGTMCLDLAGEGNRIAAAASQRILNSLYFTHINARQAAIKDAHAHTFEWAFTDSLRTGQPQSTIHRWLKSGDGIYWISGKAGSGKSTLVRYLCGNYRTYHALKLWAGRNELVIASFYFWSAGNPMQKSQQGLLQSLLYQILSQHPQLIPVVCPSRWKEPTMFKADRWTLQELCQVFDMLAEQGQLATRFCFFVDGLDEYDGEHMDIIQILERLAKLPGIKLCVSSRPWNIFLRAFEDTSQKLFVHDFTKDDIRVYAKSKLSESTRFSKLMWKDNRYQSLIEDIVKKAQGVFLWVFLVVRSLLRGLTDENNIGTLRIRLERLPADLETYFKQILNTIEDIYQEDTAQIFQMVVYARCPLPAITFSFLEREKEEPNFALEQEIDPIPETEVISESEKMRTYLNARCKDLIEVNIKPNPRSKESLTILEYQVDFLHRTVRDFLMTKEMHDLLQERAPAKFDARTALCSVQLALIKATPLSHLIGDEHGINYTSDLLMCDMLHYAREAEVHNGIPEIALLDEFNRVLLQHTTSTRSRPGSVRGLLWNYSMEKFVGFLVRAGLHHCVAQMLDRQPQLLVQVYDHPLLVLAVESQTGKEITRTAQTYEKKDSTVDVDMVRVLLDRGADPNEKIRKGVQLTSKNHCTVWELFLYHCFKYGSSAPSVKRRYGLPNELLDTAQMFIRHGADLDLDCAVDITDDYLPENPRDGKNTPCSILKTVLQASHYKQIEALMVEKRAANRGSLPLGIGKWINWK